MPGIEMDPRFTFDSFIIGPANRLAAAAARRVAEAPGSTYNPRVIYSASGLGKTHLLTAIGHQAGQVHGLEVRYETLEHLMDAISRALAAGERDVFQAGLRGAGVLLLDDVQFLAGHRQTQEELIRAWDALSARGTQVVLTSDRPPQDMDGLDERLLSRLSGGLIVDMSAPDYETRVAIARKKADERGQSLSADVFQAIARVAFTNVRELQGALNRLIAVQELEQRTVTPDEVGALLGTAAAERGRDEFGEFLSEITGTVSSVVEEADRHVADALLAWEGEGYRTRRLEGALSGTITMAQAGELVRRFESDVGRLREIEEEIRGLDPGAPELRRRDVLRDPDRIAEAEALLAAVRARQTPPPAPPPDADRTPLDGDHLAARAARAVVERPGDAYNPLYLLGPEGAGKTALLAALGAALVERHGTRVAFLGAGTFESELVQALEHNRLEAWRARYRSARALIVDDLDDFAGTERSQEELFHLFEDLLRSGGQLCFAGRVPPQDLPLAERLRTRLESGLVVELAGPVIDGAEAADAAAPAADGGNGVAPALESPREPRPAHWVGSREKVLWEWPYTDDWIEESLD